MEVNKLQYIQNLKKQSYNLGMSDDFELDICCIKSHKHNKEEEENKSNLTLSNLSDISKETSTEEGTSTCQHIASRTGCCLLLLLGL